MVTVFFDNNVAHATLNVSALMLASLDIYLPKSFCDISASISLIQTLSDSVTVLGNIGGSVLTACPAYFPVISTSNDFLFNNQIASLQYVLNLVNTVPTSFQGITYNHTLFNVTNNIHYTNDIYSYLAQQALYWFYHIWYGLMPLLFAIFVKLFQSNPRSISSLLFFIHIREATASELTNDDLHRGRVITLVLTWFAYIVTFAIYDAMYREWANNRGNVNMFGGYGRSWVLTREYFIGRLQLSIFIFIINLGVLFSTLFWYLEMVQPYSVQMWYGLAISFTVSAICSGLWIWFRALNPGRFPQWQLSLMRCTIESFAFNALSWANFALWNLWLTVDLPELWLYLIPFITGLTVYVPVSIAQMWLETNSNNYIHYVLYSFVYIISFSLLSFSSSGLFGLYSINATLLTNVIVGILSGIIISIFPMQVYRTQGTGNYRRFGIESFYQFAYFFAFAMFTFVWFTYIPLIP